MHYYAKKKGKEQLGVTAEAVLNFYSCGIFCKVGSSFMACVTLYGSVDGRDDDDDDRSNGGMMILFKMTMMKKNGFLP